MGDWREFVVDRISYACLGLRKIAVCQAYLERAQQMKAWAFLFLEHRSTGKLMIQKLIMNIQKFDTRDGHFSCVSV